MCLFKTLVKGFPVHVVLVLPTLVFVAIAVLAVHLTPAVVFCDPSRTDSF